MDDLNFSINIDIDKQIREKCPLPNWGELLFNWLTPFLRKKLIEMMGMYKTPYFLFLVGIQYEYGIETEIDLNKAYEYYIKAAELNESYALYKIYSIHCCDYKKFNLERNKEYEMYTLLKSMAFADAAIFFNNDTLYNIDIVYEIAYYLDLEDPNLDKVNNLFNNIKGKVDEKELKYIEAMTLIKFNMCEEDIELGLDILKRLAEEEYIEAIYKLACLNAKPSDKFIKNKDPLKAEYYFKICEERNFYKAYNDYGLFLYQENNLDRCLEILKKGIDNGNFRCYFLYYDCYLCKFDFVNGNVSELINLLEFVKRDLLTGNIFSFFEYFYLTKILKKHFDVKELDTNYEEEFLNIITNVYNNRYKYLHNFAQGIVETEFLLSYGFLNYIGVKSIRNYELAEILLKESFKLSKNFSYKRFCYSYIYKIRSKKYLTNGSNPEKLEKTKSKLFKIYQESMDHNKLEDFSSSYFYFLAKIYENGWGCKQDLISSYCFYNQASTARVKQLGTGTIIAYFRRYKACLKLKEEKYYNVSQELEIYKLSEMTVSCEDDQLCCICFENVKNVIFYPCKHLLCNKCYQIIKGEQKCPICRSKIILIK